MVQHLVTIAAVALLAAAGDSSPRSAPIKKVEVTERHRDAKGTELVVTTDEQGKVSAKAFDANGNPVEVKELPLESRALVCLPKQGKSEVLADDCQVLNYLSDGSIMKVGTASCVCYVCGGTGYCFGSTCP
jgi:hypothetical protein